MAAIEFTDIAHSYLPNPTKDADWALKPLRHRWTSGGGYALLGPSGCGKSTMLNIISGLLTPTRGKLSFDGQDVIGLPPEKRNIAQVFQFPVVYDTMTVRENLAFPLKNRGASPQHIATQVSHIASLLEIDHLLDLPAAGLSADAKQIISMGRGVIRDDIHAILLDEPLTVIDPQIKWQLRSALKRLHRQTDFTMIYVTHDQTEALTFADEIAVMHEGNIVQSGTPTELFECPRHTFVGHFIGSPGMNIVPCHPVGDHGNSVVIGEQRLEISPYTGLGQGKTELGVRPEFIRFAAPGEVGIAATIHKVQDLGRERMVHLSIDGAANLKMVGEENLEIPSFPAICLEKNRAYLYEDGWLREAKK